MLWEMYAAVPRGLVENNTFLLNPLPHCFELLLQSRNVLANQRPDGAVVEVEIAVDEEVADANDLAGGGDGGEKVRLAVTELDQRLADYFGSIFRRRAGSWCHLHNHR